MFIVRFYCWKLIINFQLDKNGIDAMLPGLFALFCGLARFESLPSGSDARGYELGDVNRGGFVPFGIRAEWRVATLGLFVYYMVLMVLIWAAPLLVCTERFQWPVKLPAHFWLEGCKGR